MAQHPHVPKFGNWKSGEEIGYTVYFDQARKGRTATTAKNPNDLLEGKKAPPRERGQGEGRGASRTKDQRMQRKAETGEVRHFSNFPAPKDVGRTTHRQPSPGRGMGAQEQCRRTSRQSASGHSYDRSPVHNKAKAVGSNQMGHGDGARNEGPRGRAARHPGVGPALPKFGDWNVKDPAALGSGYTVIFNQVRAERQKGPPANANNNPPAATIDPRSRHSTKFPSPASHNHKSCCFPWGSRGHP